MNPDLLHQFITSITPIMLQAGEMAVARQGKVVNFGKVVSEERASDPERIKQRARAKTEIDERVQERLLVHIRNQFGDTRFVIDAEEDTPARKLFTSSSASLVLVIDPIDGTLEYVTGSDRYSINVGLIENGKVLTTLIYYPAHRRLYYLDEHQKPTLVTYGAGLGEVGREQLRRPVSVSRDIVYVSNRVSPETIAELRENHITVIEDDGAVLWPEALLKCLSGEYTASIFHTPQTRDVLLGAMIERLPGGYMYDWRGEKMTWPDGGRMPRAIFGFGDLPKRIFDCIHE